MFDMESREANHAACADECVTERLCDRVKETRKILDEALGMAASIEQTLFGPPTEGESPRKNPECLKDEMDGVSDRARDLLCLLYRIAGRL